jgi:CRP-like cAMP-binding protein
MAPARFAMLKVSLLGVTVTIGRDDESEAYSPGRQPGTKPEIGAGPDRSRWAARPNRLADSLPRPPAWHRPRQAQFSAGSFWAALDPREQQDFTAVAQRRAFPRGAVLMREGDPADHVIVVLSGRTKICVSEHGRELLLAERGSGELIGERAALEVSERSATVIALTTVHVLVVTTEQFAEFVSSHPRVLGLVEGQVYARLTEGPDRGVQPRRLKLAGENCTVVLTDVNGFGGQHRNEEDRQILRRALYDMTLNFLNGLDAVCSCEDRGDGFLLIIPPGVPTSAVMKGLLRDLPPVLRLHNHRYSSAMQIQLRVAVNVGPVVSDVMGVSGDAIISTARLVEAPVLKESMRQHHPNLGVIVSAFVYETAVKPSATEPDLRGYQPVEVTVKEASFPAWMKLVDPDAPRILLLRHAVTAA